MQILPGPNRVNRKVYWIFFAIHCVFSTFVWACTINHVTPGAIGFVSLIFSLVSMIIQGRRFHDFGWPGWVPWAYGFGWFFILAFMFVGALASIGGSGAGQAEGAVLATLLSMIGVVIVMLLVNFVYTIVIGCIPGNAHANRYGPPPGDPNHLDGYGDLREIFGDGPDAAPTPRVKAQPQSSFAIGGRTTPPALAGDQGNFKSRAQAQMDILNARAGTPPSDVSEADREARYDAAIARAVQARGTSPQVEGAAPVAPRPGGFGRKGL